MQKQILYISATLALLGVSSAQFRAGKCEEIQLQDKFDATRYTGVWFEIVRDPIASRFEKFECQEANYQLYSDGVLSVHNSQFNTDIGQVESKFANGTCNGAHCSVRFFDNPPYVPAGDYRVVDTDYESYSLVYSCLDIPDQGKLEYAWILSRTPELADSLFQHASDVLKKKVKDYDQSKFHHTKQGKDCTYLQ
ncbi:apolipoprotein d [Stylonychia lemnae]|uniref:Apolipoprotein d n=1 Tax=Stylonychia lemnae TaxID=5949 RepID=A0A078ACX1_STYLE|nr:apolipoprotein d [Stylonychia lemnae]|eukprot:CDW78698.1 apolipoprotein d [Stylonychia lemnae]